MGGGWDSSTDDDGFIEVSESDFDEWEEGFGGQARPAVPPAHWLKGLLRMAQAGALSCLVRSS